MNSEMRAIIDKYKREYFDKYYVIGVQIRKFYVYDQNIKRFINCALEIENFQHPQKQVKWFLAIDTNGILDSFTSYSSKIFSTEGEPLHVSFQKNGSKAMKKALLDIELLSLCDEIITTAGSTFSFISVLKQQRLPYVVEGQRYTDYNCRRWTLLSKTPRSPNTNNPIFK
jgi:hypothetical protein